MPPAVPAALSPNSDARTSLALVYPDAVQVLSPNETAADSGVLTAGADPRRDGQAVAF